MKIDLMGDKTYTSHEIKYIAQDEIAAKWNRSSEANIQRKLQGLALNLYAPTTEEIAEIEQYKTDLYTIQAEAAQAEIDNQLLIDTIAYEQALQRLSRYRLAEGRPEQVVYAEDGVTVVQVIEAIAPLAAVVESMDDQGNVINVPNPAIVQDDSERAAAQTLIDSAPDTVVSLHALRNP